MLVPKIFRLLFFRQKGIRNAFDAVRNSDTLYINIDEALSDDINVLKSNTLLSEVVQGLDYKQVIVIYGHNKLVRSKVYHQLNDLGYYRIYDIGTVKDLDYVKQSTS